MWIYRARIYSPSRQFVTTCERAISNEDAGEPEIRAYVEQLVECEIRGMEGVAPDAPIERDGWHYEEL